MNHNDSEPVSAAPDGKPAENQPDWRREFPIDVGKNNEVARRDFTHFLVLTSLAFAAGQVSIGIMSWLRGRQPPPSAQPLARLDPASPAGQELPMLPVGGSLMFHYPDAGEPCILLRPDESTVLAYNQKCTHLSCAVTPRLEDGRLHCPCHHGTFDLQNGRPIAGPPRRPLARVQLEVREGVVYAVGVELRTV